MNIALVRLIVVVSQFLDCHDPIPMIVAEMIDNLDRIRDGDSTVLGGSPSLLQIKKHFFFAKNSFPSSFLQMWLTEHLQIVAFPLERFRPRDFATRQVKVDFKSGGEWRAWLRNIQAGDIE